MAWYYGTYSCGHEGRVDITGPVKNRQGIADKKFSGLCPECAAKKKADEIAKANQEAEQKSSEMNLVELVGSEKQVAWANTIRLDLIEKVVKFIEEKEYDEWDLTLEQCEKAINIMKNETKATWFINNRTRHDLDLVEFLNEEE